MILLSPFFLIIYLVQSNNRKIKEFLGFTDYCPRHKELYKYRGKGNRICGRCWDETIKNVREEVQNGKGKIARKALSN